MGPEQWDQAIAGYDGRLIFHGSPWLGFLAETRRGRLLRCAIADSGATIGYFAGLIVRKGPWTLLGSPLTGWVTDLMGPVANRPLDGEQFLAALETFCREQRVDFLQIGSERLAPDLMRRHGYGVTAMTIFRIPLAPSPEEMGRRLAGKCRNRIRRGLANGLVVEEATDAGFVDEYHAQHVEVFARQGLPPKYSVAVVRSLWRHLHPRDQLLCLRVRHGERTIATGLFPHDQRRLYSFGIASWARDRSLCPNELLYWTAMCRGGARGLESFSLGGAYRTPASGGQFKEKFHGDEVLVYRYTKGFSWPARLAHRAYQGWLALNCRRRAQPVTPGGAPA